MRETYSYKDANPLGTKVAYKIIGQAYPDNYINVINSSFNKYFNYTNEKQSLYICITGRLHMSDDDIDALGLFVKNGNTVLLSANNFDSSLLSTFGIKQSVSDFYDFIFSTRMGDTYVRSASDSILRDRYQYYFFPFLNSFEIDSLSSFTTKVIGNNATKKVNAVFLSVGKGRLILHCEPRAFSNYFLLTSANRNNLTNFINLMPKEAKLVYWDNYYRSHKGDSSGKGSFWSILASLPALQNAFFLLLAAFLIYVLFGSKRKQRVIPIIKPVENSSIKFAEAIAGLYMRDRDHKSIADKMVVHFLEYIRNRYYLNTNNLNADFVKTLSRKSGYPEDKTAEIFLHIAQIAASNNISGDELLALNKKIENFHKKAQ